MMSAAEQLCEVAKKMPEETAQEMLDHLAKLRQQRSEAVVAEVREAQEEHRQGNYQVLTVAELMQVLEDD